MQQIDVNTKVNIPVIDFAQPKTIDITPENESEEHNNKPSLPKQSSDN
jgi:hypothetical protein